MARHLESSEQRAFVQWCRLHPVARRVFAIPNGGKRSKIEAAIMKGEGVTPGVPDLMLPVARHQAHGLFIEMKAPNGRESPEQKAKIDEMASDGYACVVAYGADCAISAVIEYLSSCMPPGKYIIKPASLTTR